jgi:hypothetical protein
MGFVGLGICNHGISAFSFLLSGFCVSAVKEQGEGLKITWTGKEGFPSCH